MSFKKKIKSLIFLSLVLCYETMYSSVKESFKPSALTELDIRVKECLKTSSPGRCIRSRGLVIPNQNSFHRFAIHGGDLNVGRRVGGRLPYNDPEHLREDFYQLLMSSRTNLNTRDGLGLTPLDYVTKNSNKYAIMKRAGAKHSKDL